MKNTGTELLDLDTLVKVKIAAPHVTVIPFDLAGMVVNGLEVVAINTGYCRDQEGRMYWQASLKDLHAACDFEFEVTLKQIGGAVKSMGLETWRKGDGFHVAWSREQLDILKAYFLK